LSRLYVLIVGRDPRQLQSGFALWTREMIRRVVRREFGIALSVVSVGRLLGKLGLSPKWPLHRAYQQDPEAAERWKRQTSPAICKEAEAAGAVIGFADEAGIRSDCHAGTPLVSQWPHAGGGEHREPGFREHDLRRLGEGRAAVCCLWGNGERGHVHRFLQAAAA
jgi:hypothetical protein